MPSISLSSSTAYEAELAEAIEASKAAASASSSNAAGALQGRAIITCPALQEMPHDLLQLIGSFNSHYEFHGDETTLRRFETLTHGTSLGSFSPEVLMMRPDVALCDAIWSVNGDVAALDAASRERLTQFAPHIRHLSLSRLYMTAAATAELIRALAFYNRKEATKPVTSIETLTLSDQTIDSDTLAAIAACKTEGLLGRLTTLEIDMDGDIQPYIPGDLIHRKSRTTITEEGMTALKQSGLLQDLETLIIPGDARSGIGDRTGEPAFSYEIFKDCTKLREFRCHHETSANNIRLLDQQKTLKQLSTLQLGKFAFNEDIASLQLLGEADMQLQHLVLHNDFYAQTLHAALQNGSLTKVFARTETISFGVRLVRNENARLFSDMQAAGVELQKTTHLALRYSALSAELLQELARTMPHLRELKLFSCSLQLPDIAHFAQLSHVTHLEFHSLVQPDPSSVNGRWVPTDSPEGIEFLTQIVNALPALKHLTVVSDDITKLPLMPKLDTLCMRSGVRNGPRSEYFTQTYTQEELQKLHAEKAAVVAQ